MTGAHDARSYAEQLAAARAFIQAHNDFLVVAHVNPDGDAASSTVAVGWMLGKLGKRYTMINEGKTPDKFSYLWGFDQLLRYDQLPTGQQFRAVISVDCADEARIGQVREAVAEGALLLNIDHHATNQRFGDTALVRADAAATVELLFDLASELGLALEPELATALYTGLVTDTGGFRYSSTSPRVMQIAAELLAAGVEGHRIAEQTLEKVTYAHIQLLKRSLGSLSFAYGRRVGWMIVTPEDLKQSGAAPEDMDGLILYPRNIEEVEVALLFKQLDERTVKVSLRSNTETDVAAVAQTFGGGGHRRAAGCTAYGTLDEVIAQVIKEVGQSLQ